MTERKEIIEEDGIIGYNADDIQFVNEQENKIINSILDISGIKFDEWIVFEWDPKKKEWSLMP